MVTPSASGSKRDLDRGRVLILLAALLWSLAGVFIKLLEIHPLTIVFYRSFFASLVFVPFLKSSQFHFNAAIIISVISYTAAITAFVSANKLTTAANAIVLQYTAPVLVYLFSRLVLGEKISTPNALALAVSMVGVGFISIDSAGEPEMSGVLLALLSGVLFAIYMVNLQQINRISAIYLTWLNNLVCALLILPFLKTPLALSSDQLLIVAIMGAVQLGLPYFLFSTGLRTIPLQEAALIALIEPVLNPVWVALIVGEIPSFATLIGGAMILTALAVRYLGPILR
ncbi:MAG TPA: EamA family transporter [Candidatus Binatia bacterium]|nr:EamA family transporter [Candidatus Binatia bacterium]HET9297580.1 EamA family transporter [Candidatus Binatia bacterium]